MPLKNGVLEGSGIDFGASKPRFWSLQASILEPPASILKPPGSIVEPPGLQPSFAYASHIQQHHLANVGQSLAWGSFLLCFCLPQQPCQSVGGGGVPPWGPSMELAPNSLFEFTRLPSLTFLNARSFKNDVLEASGFDFGGPET